MKMVYQSFDTEAMSKPNHAQRKQLYAPTYTDTNSQFPLVHTAEQLNRNRLINHASFEVNLNRKNENFICMTSYRVNNENQNNSDAHYNSLQDERSTDDLSEVRLMCCSIFFRLSMQLFFQIVKLHS